MTKLLRCLTLVLCLLLVSSRGAAQVAPLIANISSRQTTSLDGQWQAIVDPYDVGALDYRAQPLKNNQGFYKNYKPQSESELVEYDFDGSGQLHVPGDWNTQRESLLFYEGSVWYKRSFDYAKSPKNRLFLHFGACNYLAAVYLNGEELGEHEGGFTPFDFEITNRVRAHGNFLVLRINDSRGKDQVPTVNTDWWNYGGITRDVFVSELPQTYISDYKVQLGKKNQNLIDGFIQLSAKKKNEKITLLIDEAGIRTTINTDDSGKAAVNIVSRQLKLWSPENPKLYDVAIVYNGDTINDKIGFRTIEVKGQDILLNGKSVFLRGISLHDENPEIPGRLRSQGDMRMMLQWAKELNCNYVRLAHYPHNEEMVRLADEMGLLVWAEIPVYWTISWENADTYNNAAQQLTDLIARDKNRASVIIWSVGNETPVNDKRNLFLGKLIDHARSLDDSRLLAAALEIDREGDEIFVNDPLGEKLDLASFNEYAGWYWGGASDITKYTFKVKYNKPVIISEFGGDALAGFHADENTRWSEEYQAALYKNQFILLGKLPGLRGMTPWILCDFRSPRRQQPYFQDYFNRKGLISETGKKKMAFDVLKAYYQMVQQKYDTIHQ